MIVREIGWPTHGYDRQNGRKTDGQIGQRQVEKTISQRILFGSLSGIGGRVSVTVENNELRVDIEATVKEK